MEQKQQHTHTHAGLARLHESGRSGCRIRGFEHEASHAYSHVAYKHTTTTIHAHTHLQSTRPASKAATPPTPRSSACDPRLRSQPASQGLAPTCAMKFLMLRWKEVSL